MTAQLAVAEQEFVTASISGQMFGIPVQEVQDVLGPQKITRIPLAPPEVAGSLNLRGRIVTAIDVRRRLGLPDRATDAQSWALVVEQKGQPYALLVDSVGEVLRTTGAAEEPPSTIAPSFRAYAKGVRRQPGCLLIELDYERLMRELAD